MRQPCSLLLRPGRVTDAHQLAELARCLIEHGLAWRYTPQRIAALIAHPETMVVVAADGAQVQGFATMQFGDDDAHLMLLCVQPTQRHRGLGRRLTEWLLASARVAGAESIALELRADNAAALAFYGRLGFTPTGVVADYYDGRIAAQRMLLRLRAGSN